MARDSIAEQTHPRRHRRPGAPALRLDVEFIAAAAAPEQFPALGLPEIVLAGRSNVGKSSFLNALAGGKSVARTSRWPGRTRTVNFYRVGGYVVVDLPGYGFAQVSKEERNRWKTVIESYLSRPEVKLAVLLVDARTGATESDRTMAGWLQARRCPFLVAPTKVDQLRGGAATRVVADVAATLAVDTTAIRPLSAVTGAGMKDAWNAIVERIRLAAPPAP